MFKERQVMVNLLTQVAKHMQNKLVGKNDLFNSKMKDKFIYSNEDFH